MNTQTSSRNFVLVTILLAACGLRQTEVETQADFEELDASGAGSAAATPPSTIAEVAPVTEAEVVAATSPLSRPYFAPAQAQQGASYDEADEDSSAAPRRDAVVTARSERAQDASKPAGPTATMAKDGAASGATRSRAYEPARKNAVTMADALASMPPPSAPIAADDGGVGGGNVGDGDGYVGDDGVDRTSSTGAEDYTDYGVNPFTIVAEDALSTFSIDVDTASYALARRKLTEGTLPSFASVRAEEFVNYFDYGYTAPDDDPFAVNMEAMPDPFRPGHHILRIGVQGKEVSRDERPPLHLTFLVDVSGSMSSSDKLPLAKESLHMLVDSLREDDTVALAVYAGRTAKVLDPTLAGDKRAIHGAIEMLSSGGSTAMSAGIDIAYELAQQGYESGHENRVIILSDGDANVGRTSFDDMLSQIKGHADEGVTLSTIGFGMGNYKDTLMEQLANKGDGNNFYIDSQEQARRVFVDNIGGTLLTIARDTKIQVEFNPESVRAYRLIGYENRDIADQDFRNDRVDAGEVGAGHSVTALYDVILKDGYTRDLANVRLRYEKPGPDGPLSGNAATEKLWRFGDRSLKETPTMASRDTRIAYSAATFAEILRASPNAAEISLDELAKFAARSARPGEQDDLELVGLMKAASGLGAGKGGGVAVR